jgi:parallel beta-helix repeat protein
MLSALPALGLGSATVSLGSYQISTATEYIVNFTVDKQLTGGVYPAGDYISITWPAGTTLVAGTGNTIMASPGWYNGVWADSVIPTPSFSWALISSRTLVCYLGAGATVGEGAEIRVKIPTSATNPDAAGSYQIYVTTKQEATPIATAAYSIVNPSFNPLPGLIKVFNTAGTQIWQAQGEYELTDVIDNHLGAGYTVELGAGWYVEGDMNLDTEDVTIKGSGAVGDVVVQGQLDVNADGVTLKGITMRSATAGATTLEIYYDDVLVDGCAFSRYYSTTSTTAQTFVYVDNDTADGTGTITNCTFDSTLSSANGDHCIIVEYAGWYDDTYPQFNINKNKFTLDGSSTSRDIAIETGADEVFITENEFTGTSGAGWGIYTYDWGYTEIYKNKFTGLTQALEVDEGSEVGFWYNTVDKCGYVSTTAPQAAIAVWYTEWCQISGNTITNSLDWAIEVDDDCYTTVVGNTFTGNAKGISNIDEDCGLDATRNWWGAAAGPAAGYNSDEVDDSHPLGAAPSAVYVDTWTTEIDGRDVVPAVPVTVDLDYQSVFNPDDEAYMIGAMTFASNPEAVAVPTTLSNAKYFDVFVVDPPQATFLSELGIQIRFYGTIKANSEIWVYSGDSGEWVKCSMQSRNTASGFITVNVTEDSVPDIEGMDGTAFALVEAPPEAPAGTAVTQSPVLGAINVPIDTTFTWPAVAGATSYIFELAEETGQTDKFYLKDEVGGPTVNAYKLVDDLKYNTQYWWRVQAVTAAGKSAWTTSFFTTEKEPVVVEQLPPVIVEENPPAQITLEIPPDTVEKVEPIPAYLLWAVIAVGAILVIVVIVLIVRTRRIS